MLWLDLLSLSTRLYRNLRMKQFQPDPYLEFVKLRAGSVSYHSLS